MQLTVPELLLWEASPDPLGDFITADFVPLLIYSLLLRM